jgi:cyanophycinase
MRSCVVALFVFSLSLMLHANNLRAEESIIGLPQPIDPAKPGAVLLHGGGRVTDDAFYRFIQEAGGKNARIVFVPCAGFSRYNYSTKAEFISAVSRYYGSWANLKAEGKVADFQYLYTDNNTDCFDAGFCNPLSKATGVWFSGGAQSRLNYRFVNFPNPNKFQIALRGVLERGGIVGGTSAGMAAAPEIMTVMDYRPTSTGPADAYVWHGLGLFDRAIVEQHFDARGGRLERFTSLLKDTERLNKLSARPHVGEKMIGLACEESTGLLVRGNRMEVVGRNSAHVFVKSNNGRSIQWNELKAGENALLQLAPANSVQFTREEVRLQQR